MLTNRKNTIFVEILNKMNVWNLRLKADGVV